ncbi:hypothetical protein E3A20_12260 [Planctomyces bekefii]|uniref:Uncharacterized protein n=1 Tax=Planctomyces bekefii TaxID=1653850 RepID=A0A5C6M659_9PLAN|nr:hypothetical protein E3A20_12260 [Planctomyces bekefii]
MIVAIVTPAADSKICDGTIVPTTHRNRSNPVEGGGGIIDISPAFHFAIPYFTAPYFVEAATSAPD